MGNWNPSQNIPERINPENNQNQNNNQNNFVFENQVKLFQFI